LPLGRFALVISVCYPGRGGGVVFSRVQAPAVLAYPAVALVVALSLVF